MTGWPRSVAPARLTPPPAGEPPSPVGSGWPTRGPERWCSAARRPQGVRKLVKTGRAHADPGHGYGNSEQVSACRLPFLVAGRLALPGSRRPHSVRSKRMPGLLRKPRRALVPGTCPELDDRHARTRNKITIAANAYSAGRRACERQRIPAPLTMHSQAPSPRLAVARGTGPNNWKPRAGAADLGARHHSRPYIERSSTCPLVQFAGATRTGPAMASVQARRGQSGCPGRSRRPASPPRSRSRPWVRVRGRGASEVRHLGQWPVSGPPAIRWRRSCWLAIWGWRAYPVWLPSSSARADRWALSRRSVGRQDGASESDPLMLAEYVTQYPKIFVR